MSSTEVPGLYAALTAQTKQAFFELIKHYEPDAVITIEKDDDVAVSTGNMLDLIQVKSATSDNRNPLSNNSKDLWKTLSNWIMKLSGGQYGEKEMSFKYSVCSSRDLNVGSIVKLFQDARGCIEAEAAYGKAQAMVSDSTTGQQFKTTFFEEGNRSYAIEVIVNFGYEFHRDFMREIEDLFYEVGPFPDTWRKNLFREMTGWLEKQASNYTKQGKPVVLQRVDYYNQLVACSGAYRENPFSVSVDPPTKEEILEEQKAFPTYLRQLKLIKLGSEEETKAIVECLRSRMHFKQYADELQIIGREIEDYQDELVSDWEDIKAIQQESNLHKNEEQIGLLVFHESRKSSRSKTIRGCTQPSYVGPGQLHDLADSQRIGWHPDYRNLLS